MTPSRHWPSELGLIVALLALLAPFVWTSAFPQDEFTTLSNARRMLEGAVIYRDFFEFTAPLSHGLLSWAFAIAGPSLLVARVLQAALLVIAGWGLYRLARRFGVGAWTATLPGLLVVLAIYRTLPGYNHHWVVLPFLVGALWAGVRGLDEGRARWWAIAGALSGLGLLTMQSDGAVCAIALAGAAVLGGGARLRNLVALSAGGLLPLMLAGLYFLLHGAAGDAWYHVFTWTLQQYKTAGSVNDVKYATDLTALLSTMTDWINLPFWYAKAYHVLYLYALVPLMALVALLWGLDWLRRRRAEEAGFGLLALLAIGFAALAMRGKADFVHVAAYAWPAVLFAVVLADRAVKAASAPELRYVRELPRLSLWAFALTGALLVAGESKLHPEAWLSRESPDARLSSRPAFQYLRAHSTPADRIVAMPYGGFYYFYGRRPASRYTLMLPPRAGYYTAAEYEAFWKEVLEKRPKFVIFSLWNGRKALGEYFLHPLPGYREAAWVPMAEGDQVGEVGFWERED